MNTSSFQVHDDSFDRHVFHFPESHEATQRKGHVGLILGDVRGYFNPGYYTGYHGGAFLRRR